MHLAPSSSNSIPLIAGTVIASGLVAIFFCVVIAWISIRRKRKRRQIMMGYEMQTR